jgi:hypothetical protein
MRPLPSQRRPLRVLKVTMSCINSADKRRQAGPCSHLCLPYSHPGMCPSCPTIEATLGNTLASRRHAYPLGRKARGWSEPELKETVPSAN